MDFIPKDPANALATIFDFGVGMAYSAKAVMRDFPESGTPSFTAFSMASSLPAVWMMSSSVAPLLSPTA